MLVAIIDTGIYPGIFPTGPIAYDMEVTRFGVVRKRKRNICSFHGAFVAAILEKYAPGCHICSIKIFDDETQKTTSRMLCAALRWCQSKNIPVINISAGLTEKREFQHIGRIIDGLKKNGQIVVAAYNKNGMLTMPAGHRTVIGVRTVDTLTNDDYIPDNTSEKKDYIASSHHELKFLSGISITTSDSTSFATPTITAAIINLNLKNI